MESLASQAVDDPRFALGKRSRRVISVSEYHKQLTWIHTRLFGQQQLETVLQGSNGQLLPLFMGSTAALCSGPGVNGTPKKQLFAATLCKTTFTPLAHLAQHLQQFGISELCATQHR